MPPLSVCLHIWSSYTELFYVPCQAVVSTTTNCVIAGCPTTVQGHLDKEQVHKQYFENLYEYKVTCKIIKFKFSGEQ